MEIKMTDGCEMHEGEWSNNMKNGLGVCTIIKRKSKYIFMGTFCSIERDCIGDLMTIL
jgi:hypothetical protein